MNITVSIVVYKTPVDQYRRTFEALKVAVEHLISEWDNSIGFHYVLINNSSDGFSHKTALYHVGDVGDLFQTVSYLEPSENEGYGKAHNMALMQYNSDYYLVLNPDVQLDCNALKEALFFMQKHTECGLVTPSVYNPEGKMQYLCKQYPSMLVLLLRGVMPSFVWRWFDNQMNTYEMRDMHHSGDVNSGIMLASGCCMFLRGDVVRRLKGFSDKFFLYFEDYDLCMRLRYESDIAYLPSMTIIHEGGHTAKKGVWHVLMFCHSAYKFFNIYGWRWK